MVFGNSFNDKNLHVYFWDEKAKKNKEKRKIETKIKHLNYEGKE